MSAAAVLVVFVVLLGASHSAPTRSADPEPLLPGDVSLVSMVAKFEARYHFNLPQLDEPLSDYLARASADGSRPPPTGWASWLKKWVVLAMGRSSKSLRRSERLHVIALVLAQMAEYVPQSELTPIVVKFILLAKGWHRYADNDKVVGAIDLLLSQMKANMEVTVSVLQSLDHKNTVWSAKLLAVSNHLLCDLDLDQLETVIKSFEDSSVPWVAFKNACANLQPPHLVELHRRLSRSLTRPGWILPSLMAEMAQKVAQAELEPLVIQFLRRSQGWYDNAVTVKAVGQLLAQMRSTVNIAVFALQCLDITFPNDGIANDQFAHSSDDLVTVCDHLLRDLDLHQLEAVIESLACRFVPWDAFRAAFNRLPPMQLTLLQRRLSRTLPRSDWVRVFHQTFADSDLEEQLRPALDDGLHVPDYALLMSVQKTLIGKSGYRSALNHAAALQYDASMQDQTGGGSRPEGWEEILELIPPAWIIAQLFQLDGSWFSRCGCVVSCAPCRKLSPPCNCIELIGDEFLRANSSRILLRSRMPGHDPLVGVVAFFEALNPPLLPPLVDPLSDYLVRASADGSWPPPTGWKSWLQKWVDWVTRWSRTDACNWFRMPWKRLQVTVIALVLARLTEHVPQSELMPIVVTFVSRAKGWSHCADDTRVAGAIVLLLSLLEANMEVAINALRSLDSKNTVWSDKILAVCDHHLCGLDLDQLETVIKSFERSSVPWVAFKNACANLQPPQLIEMHLRLSRSLSRSRPDYIASLLAEMAKHVPQAELEPLVIQFLRRVQGWYDDAIAVRAVGQVLALTRPTMNIAVCVLECFIDKVPNDSIANDQFVNLSDELVTICDHVLRDLDLDQLQGLIESLAYRFVPWDAFRAAFNRLPPMQLTLLQRRLSRTLPRSDWIRVFHQTFADSDLEEQLRPALDDGLHVPDYALLTSVQKKLICRSGYRSALEHAAALQDAAAASVLDQNRDSRWEEILELIPPASIIAQVVQFKNPMLANDVFYRTSRDEFLLAASSHIFLRARMSDIVNLLESIAILHLTRFSGLRYHYWFLDRFLHSVTPTSAHALPTVRVLLLYLDESELPERNRRNLSVLALDLALQSLRGAEPDERRDLIASLHGQLTLLLDVIVADPKRYAAWFTDLFAEPLRAGRLAAVDVLAHAGLRRAFLGAFDDDDRRVAAEADLKSTASLSSVCELPRPDATEIVDLIDLVVHALPDRARRRSVHQSLADRALANLAFQRYLPQIVEFGADVDLARELVAGLDATSLANSICYGAFPQSHGTGSDLNLSYLWLQLHDESYPVADLLDPLPSDTVHNLISALFSTPTLAAPYCCLRLCNLALAYSLERCPEALLPAIQGCSNFCAFRTVLGSLVRWLRTDHGIVDCSGPIPSRFRWIETHRSALSAFWQRLAANSPSLEHLLPIARLLSIDDFVVYLRVVSKQTYVRPAQLVELRDHLVENPLDCDLLSGQLAWLPNKLLRDLGRDLSRSAAGLRFGEILRRHSLMDPIDYFTDVAFQDGHDCPICLESVQTLKTLHGFHHVCCRCLAELIERRTKSCPLCRHPIDLHPVDKSVADRCGEIYAELDVLARY